MSSAKILVTVNADLLRQVDQWVADGEFASRSQAVEAGLRVLQAIRYRRDRLSKELAKLDPGDERRFADERLIADEPWPAY